MIIFSSKCVFKKHLHLRPFYIILRQQNNFEWTKEHQKYVEEKKIPLTEQR